jgi:hypothetical protein
MPFTNPTPLEVDPLVLVGLIIGIVQGIVSYLKFSKIHEERLKSGEEPYAGHHYQRRAAKKML